MTPAACLPEMIGEKRKSTFCIVNLQKTSMDHLCDNRIFAKCDDVMNKLMDKLSLKIPSWKLKRYIKISIDTKKNLLSVYGIDSDGTPYDILSGIKLMIKDDKNYEKTGSCLDGAVFKVNKKVNLLRNEICLELGFMGRYNEPNLIIDLKKYWNGNDSEFILNLDYCPYERQWQVINTNETNNQDMKVNDEELKNNGDKDEREVEDIFVGNMHELKRNEENNKHLWTMFVSTKKNNLVSSRDIDQVIYNLHPTFNPSRIIVKDAPYLLKRLGWGYFEIGITIKFKKNANRKDIKCKHLLNFDHGVTIKKIYDGKGSNHDDKDTIYHSDNIKKFIK